MDLWLSVIDYAVVKKVSVSTLRRRIKSNTLECKFENGRYLIRVQQNEMHEQNNDEITGNIVDDERSSRKYDKSLNGFSGGDTTSVPMLIQELKSAYHRVLSEKEEMIQQLKSEIEILKHINHFMEQQILRSDSINPSYPSQGLSSTNGFNEENL